MYINILVARIHYLDFYSYICTCNITRKKNQQFMIVFNYKKYNESSSDSISIMYVPQRLSI